MENDPMKVRVDVYTKDLDAALAAFKSAVKEGAYNVSLRTDNDYDTKVLNYLNLDFEGDHSMECIGALDNGPFSDDQNNLD
jgi:ribonuclease HI